VLLEFVIELCHTKENNLDAGQRAGVSLSQDRHAARRVPDPSRSGCVYSADSATGISFPPRQSSRLESGA
jgi:hypothetical protein